MAFAAQLHFPRNEAELRQLEVTDNYIQTGMAAPVDPATRKKVLRVVFFSLLLDLVRALGR